MTALILLAKDVAAYVDRLAYVAGVHARPQGRPREVPAGAPDAGREAFLRGWDEETRRLALVTGEA